MPHWEMPWQVAAILAACLFSCAAAARPAGRRLASAVPFLRESGLVVALYALWQYAGSFSVMGTGGAIGRAQWIWRTERAWHLPAEDAVQRLVLPHPLVVEAFNLYYAVMHFTVLIIFLIWLFARHRDAYPRTRAILVCVTAASLLIQLVPVAPPRMLSGIGLVDTAQVYGQSVYGLAVADQFSAMPSVHVAWAMLIAWSVWRATRSWRGRSLAISHTVVTWVVVVATANHFWLDGIAATALLVVAVAAAAALRPVLAALTRGAGVAGRAVAPGVRAVTRRAASAHEVVQEVVDETVREVAQRHDPAPAENPADKLVVPADVRSLGVQ